MKFFQKKQYLVISVLLTILISAYSENYQLKKGDTLYSIARNYQISVSDLMEANGIENPSSLKVGMILTIPGTVSSSALHRVERGDTYYSISRKYGMEVSELLALNRLSESNVLSIDQELRVIGGESAPPTTQPTSPLTNGGVPTTTTTLVEANPIVTTPKSAPHPAEGPQISLSLTSRKITTPDWPVSGSLFSVEGDFKGFMIESSPSTYVQAVTAGSVVWAGPYWGFGQVVLIDYNDSYYFYGGNSDIFVNVGQEITPGTRLGRLDNINGKGNMYFTVFKEGKVVDLAMARN